MALREAQTGKRGRARDAAQSVAAVGEARFLNDRVTLFKGDCRDAISRMPDNSVDAVVTDPPYALETIRKRFGSEGAAPAKSGKTGAFARASRGFMGQQWDTGEVAFDEAFWRDVCRVVKPGGHIFAFSGTRTYHHMAVAIERGGFECRDQFAWTYGTGFPKSHDVGKAIDKRRVEDVEPTRVVCRFLRAAMDAKGLKSRDLTQHFGDCNPRLIDHWAARDTDSQPALPTPQQWQTLRAVLALGPDMDDEVARLNARKGERGDVWNEAEIVGHHAGSLPGFGAHRFSVRDTAIRAASDEAREWDGWGTAVKPAWEPIFVGRKPLIGTVAENCLAYGVGAFNIDACRIENEGGRARIGEASQDKRYAENGSTNFAMKPGPRGGDPAGKFPANILHDGSPEVLAAFPTIDGQSAARLFYSAKADAEDRHGFTHPTIKPVDVMRWLCRLAVRKGGVVLDPFAGTGTTAEAAYWEGCSAVLVEREAEYQTMIEKRMGLVLAGPDEKKRARTVAAPVASAPLFGGL